MDHLNMFKGTVQLIFFLVETQPIGVQYNDPKWL